MKEERLLQGLHERIRDVRQGPDGALYLLTDNAAGRILRVAPAKSSRRLKQYDVTTCETRKTRRPRSA